MCESGDGKWYYILCSGAVFVRGTEENDKHLHDALKDKNIRYGNPVYHICKDGFCGIESVGHGGQLVTKPIELLTDDLNFNIRADLGFVRFALMNQDGSFVDGFSFDDCIPFSYNNSVDVRPQWMEHRLNEVVNRQVRVAVELKTAILHCITATARPHIFQSQRSFADPMGL